jgi:hypothetical protein
MTGKNVCRALTTESFEVCPAARRGGIDSGDPPPLMITTYKVRFSTRGASGAGGPWPRRGLSKHLSHKHVVERPFLGPSTPGLGVCEVDGPWILQYTGRRPFNAQRRAEAGLRRKAACF